MAKKQLVNPICYKCGSNETYTTYERSDPHEHWYHNEKTNYNIYCMKCYSRYIKNPEQNKRRRYSKGKRTLMKECPRIGVCSLCRSVAPFDCKYTVIDDDGMLEVCPSCHAKLGQQRRELKMISEIYSNKGMTRSQEHRKNLSLALKGRIGTRRGMKNSNESKEKMRLFRMTQIFPSKDTKIEKTIQSLLIDNGIQFTKHKVFKIGNEMMHQSDIFIEPNIIIECDGEYWHSRPYQIIRDKLIDQELRNQNYAMIRLKEKDIENNVVGCLDKIKKEISGVTNLTATTSLHL